VQSLLTTRPVYQQLFNRITCWFNVLCTGRIRLENDRLRWAMIENILEKVADTLQRDKLVVVLITEIDRVFQSTLSTPKALHRYCPDVPGMEHG
jgi:hypothetical protein